MVKNNFSDSTEEQPYDFPRFWKWFLFGLGAREKSRPGYRRLLSWFIVLDVMLGIGAMFLTDKSFEQLATSVLVPLAGVFVGVSLTWGGAAQSTMDSNELRMMGLARSDGEYADYPYAFQSAVLVIFTSLVLWGGAGMGLWDKIVKLAAGPWLRIVIGAILVGFISMSIRLCWQMILFSHELLLAKNEVWIMVERKKQDQKDSQELSSHQD